MDKADIEICADLACIELTEASIAEYSAAMDQILEYFEIMANADIGEGTAESSALGYSELREDSAQKSPISSEIIEQAAESDDNFIVIPNVL